MQSTGLQIFRHLICPLRNQDCILILLASSAYIASSMASRWRLLASQHKAVRLAVLRFRQ